MMMSSRFQLVCSLVMGLGACAATSGGAVHPEPGTSNTDKYCASGPPEEQNCMACASKQGCGFCADPKPDAPVCQPGTSAQTASKGCNTPLVVSNEDCAAPPPASALY